MPEAVIVVVLVHTVAAAEVADVEKVAVVADTVAEAVVVVSVIFPVNAVKNEAVAIRVEHVVKAAIDADAFKKNKE
jgi:hypothetical protein